ncbi:hypothetical protein ACFO4L_01375 [Bacillus daqingensis]|uniref:DUF4181 domain-containing protein n=1 Tax=Bacillus daqingensis TaxID=872396 RepID=A0ABV9NPG5_9BACI
MLCMLYFPFHWRKKLDLQKQEINRTWGRSHFIIQLVLIAAGIGLLLSGAIFYRDQPPVYLSPIVILPGFWTIFLLGQAFFDSKFAEKPDVVWYSKRIAALAVVLVTGWFLLLAFIW